ncbi:hypothetical protein Scep_004301 [Stephania cephalantha]|uniref:Uncharacterized protein n=1 Tax=Stephania cephalantha TaxID=152367 RepID=A0AAP0KU16_9MAGN
MDPKRWVIAALLGFIVVGLSVNLFTRDNGVQSHDQYYFSFLSIDKMAFGAIHDLHTPSDPVFTIGINDLKKIGFLYGWKSSNKFKIYLVHMPSSDHVSFGGQVFFHSLPALSYSHIYDISTNTLGSFIKICRIPVETISYLPLLQIIRKYRKLLYDSHLQDSRRSVDVPSLQLQFPTWTYNLAHSYVSQPYAGMDEDNKDNNEFTSRHRPISKFLNDLPFAFIRGGWLRTSACNVYKG